MSIANKDWWPWCEDCYKWQGRLLVGEFAHWCFDWDFLPVDETVDEFTACTCFTGMGADTTPEEALRIETHKERLRAERDRLFKKWQEEVRLKRLVGLSHPTH